jgi:rod shape-determining protein MreC
VLDFDGSRKARRKDTAIAAGVLVLAFVILVLPAAYQRPVRNIFQTTLLRPFIAAQTRLAVRRSRSEDLSVVRAQRDSLAALVAAQATLSEENRQLRGLLAMRERVGAAFVPAEVVSLGMDGAESSFMVNVGSADDVREGSAVMTPAGLLGVVWEVHEHNALAIDWSHPQFRASAMTADGGAYGIVEARRGRFREEDVLELSGAPFHTDINPGKRIVTSGRGDVFPRGILIGLIIGIDEADTGWRKSYFVRPAVRPEEARHVLVGTGPSANGDFSDLWNVVAPDDTTAIGDTAAARAATSKAANKPSGNTP